MNKLGANTIFSKAAASGLLLLSLLWVAPAAQAQTAHSLEGIDWQFSDEPMWQEPVVYSLRVMGLGLAGLVALDLHDTDPSVDNFKRAFTSPAPRADDDGPMFNFVLHPLWGSETYLRARSAGMNRRESFSFSMGASVVWEYMIESWTEHPSSQDLIYTTGLGWMIGESRYVLLKNMDDENKVWADPLYALLGSVDLNVQVDPDGEVLPILNVTWEI